MPECSNCGEWVSHRYVRVAKQQNGKAIACPNCGPDAGCARGLTYADTKKSWETV